MYARSHSNQKGEETWQILYFGVQLTKAVLAVNFSKPDTKISYDKLLYCITVDKVSNSEASWIVLLDFSKLILMIPK